VSESKCLCSGAVQKRTMYLLFTFIVFLCPALVSAQSTRIAFIGDQGIGSGAEQVLALIRDEGAELVVIQGDLGYSQNAASQWISNMDSILGDDMPVLFVVGNHENYEWPTYLQWQNERLSNTPAIECEGNIAVKSYCTFEDFGFVFVAPGINEVAGIDGSDDYAQYITDAFQNDDSTWRFCSWHKNMRDMQPGGKGDATGWGVYQSCLAQGGIVLNGHEHSYSRTHLMNNFEAKQVIHTDNDMSIGPDSSIVILTGLGGREVRPQRHNGDWFASIYTSDQGASVGSLFCDFQGSSAECYFKDITGRVPDMFTLRSTRTGPQENTGQETANEAPRSTAEEQSTPAQTEPATSNETSAATDSSSETDDSSNQTDSVAIREPLITAEVSTDGGGASDAGSEMPVESEATAESPTATETVTTGDALPEVNATTTAGSDTPTEPAAIPTTTVDTQDAMIVASAAMSLRLPTLLAANASADTETEDTSLTTVASSRSDGGVPGLIYLGVLSLALSVRKILRTQQSISPA